MLTFAERRTPYRLHGFRASWLFVAFAVADAFALVVGGNFVIGSVIAAVGQPILISMWCMFGRGTALFRWSTSTALCALLWIVKVKTFGLDGEGQLALLLVPAIAEHFLLFPLAFACSQVHQQYGSSEDRAAATRATWRFRILDLFYVVTLVAIVCAASRVLLPDGISRPHFSTKLSVWLLLFTFVTGYCLLQGALVFYVVWKIWDTEVRLLRRLQSAGIEETIFVILALLSCLACSIGMTVALEFVVIIPLLVWLRRGTGIARWDGR